MSEQRTIENIPAEEFERIVDRFIEQAAAWDGALPVEDFFEAWDVVADEETPLEVQAVIVDNELLLETPPPRSEETGGIPDGKDDRLLWLQLSPVCSAF